MILAFLSFDLIFNQSFIKNKMITIYYLRSKLNQAYYGVDID